MTLEVERSGPLTGTLRPPSDKSLTHRAYIFALLAKTGSSRVFNPLVAQDTDCTRKIIEHLGAKLQHFPPPLRAGEGQGGGILVSPPPRLLQPQNDLDCGNSGTTMRLIAGVLASEPGLRAVLVGDESLSKRPMNRIVEPLALMGADVKGDTAPLAILGKSLRGIAYSSPVASAQIKSCILLAGLRAAGRTILTEPTKSRDHTERMLAALGVRLAVDENSVEIEGGQTWNAFEFDVPADISSAAFFLCAAAAIDGSQVTLTQVGTNPTRTGVLDVLKQVGANVSEEIKPDQMGEPVSDITVQANDKRPFEVSGALVPRLIDEVPVLAVLATQCEGTSKIRDAKELRVKESDRIETVAKNLRSMGATVQTYEDGLDVTGPTPLTATTVDAMHDHRIAMAFAIAGLLATGTTRVQNADSVLTSYPDFESHLRHLAAMSPKP